MRWATLTGLSVALVAYSWASAAQIPFQTDHHDPWNFSIAPSVNASAHLVFDTVSSFLQHWPNTRYRNGHNLVPGTVPVGTLLYHGQRDSNIPGVPDWTATDPEHSYLFCRGETGGCWHLTLVAVRPLQVLYFDGSSAAKMREGPMDSQDVVGWGKIMPDRYFDERQRITDLCNWGKPLGIDGYLSEIMLCDFTAGVEVVHMANLASQRREALGVPPPERTPAHPIFFQDASASAIASPVTQSGSWHNRYPGDRRIKLDLTRLVSFYDTALVPSLVSHRFQQERWDHRLLGISSADVAAVMARLTDAYTSLPQPGSGVDWDTLFKVVVDRYAERLEIARYTLNNTDGANVLATAKSMMAQLRVMLASYILHSAVPSADSDGRAWAAPVFELCATTHTGYIRRSPSLAARLTAAETLLLDAVDATQHEICRVVVGMWAGGAAAGLDDFLPVDDPVDTDVASLTQKWKGAVNDLMAWLDWSVWIKCSPGCGFEEMCYLPTWPFMLGPGGGRGDRPRDPALGAAIRPTLPEDDSYLRPQPRCVRRI
ncbi:hypothetical protein C8J57DRAFT_1366676 [Mycena rebaudengoi]|nr:hypothetical protein C8J57DRAFT_1366676 [Mycena rebaudengoi]